MDEMRNCKMLVEKVMETDFFFSGFNSVKNAQFIEFIGC